MSLVLGRSDRWKLGCRHLFTFLPGVAFALLGTVPSAQSATPLGVATFNNPAAQGNITFTPTNGFGTYVFGQLRNVTCNNPVGNAIPLNPFVGNNSVPCRVAVTLNNVANATVPRQMRYMQNFPGWDAIFGPLQLPGINLPTTATTTPFSTNPNQCGRMGPVVNPTNNMTSIPGFIGNFPVVNGTVQFAGGPFNLSMTPMDLLAKPVVLWRNAIDNIAQIWINSIPMASQLLACAPIQIR